MCYVCVYCTHIVFLFSYQGMEIVELSWRLLELAKAWTSTGINDLGYHLK